MPIRVIFPTLVTIINGAVYGKIVHQVIVESAVLSGQEEIWGNRLAQKVLHSSTM